MCVVTDALQKLAIGQEKAERNGRKFMEAPPPLKPSQGLSSHSGRPKRPRKVVEEDKILLSKIFGSAVPGMPSVAEFDMYLKSEGELTFSPLREVLEDTPWRHLLWALFPEAVGDASQPETVNFPGPIARLPPPSKVPTPLKPEVKEFFPRDSPPLCQTLVPFGMPPPPPPPALGQGVMIAAPAHFPGHRLPTPPFIGVKPVTGFIADGLYDGNGDRLYWGQHVPQSYVHRAGHTAPPSPARPHAFHYYDLPPLGGSQLQLLPPPPPHRKPSRQPQPAKRKATPDLSDLQESLEKAQGALSLMEDAGCDETLLASKRREIRRLGMEKVKAEYAGKGEDWATQLGKDVRKSTRVKAEMIEYREEVRRSNAEERAKKMGSPLSDGEE